jgi:hypothetical protein
MPSKPKAKTIAAAEKRVIRYEVSTLKKAVRKIKRPNYYATPKQSR